MGAERNSSHVTPFQCIVHTTWLDAHYVSHMWNPGWNIHKRANLYLIHLKLALSFLNDMVVTKLTYLPNKKRMKSVSKKILFQNPSSYQLSKCEPKNANACSLSFFKTISKSVTTLTHLNHSIPRKNKIFF